jgi:hypothetical protein
MPKNEKLGKKIKIETRPQKKLRITRNLVSGITWYI